MANRGIVSHVGSRHANKRLIKAGYPVSRIYRRMFENNVEAIAGGISNVESPHGDYWVVYVAHQSEVGPYKGEIARSKN